MSSTMKILIAVLACSLARAQATQMGPLEPALETASRFVKEAQTTIKGERPVITPADSEKVQAFFTSRIERLTRDRIQYRTVFEGGKIGVRFIWSMRWKNQEIRIPLAMGKIFTFEDLDRVSEKIEENLKSPDIEKKAYDAKKLHEKVLLPMRPADEDAVAQIPYALGGFAIDAAFTIAAETGVAAYNGGEQAVILAKNIAERLKTAIHNRPYNKASRMSEDLLTTKVIGPGQFAILLDALNQ